MFTKTYLCAAACAAAILTTTTQAQVNLTAGDVAIIGWVDNGSPADVLTIVSLAPLPAGTALYFTDNGWTGTAFRNTVSNGDGNEQLLKFVANNAITAGRIISTTDTSADFTWVTATPITGSTGNFTVPALAQAGDQVYVFQHSTGSDPLNTATQQHIFVLDDTGVFEPSTSSNDGDVPTGLSTANGTAITFDQNGSGETFMAFNTSSLVSGSKTDWLTAINNLANWTFGSTGTLPSGSINVGGGGGGSISSYCFGDGSGTACPCGNIGSAGNGCASSVNPNGANLAGAGSPSIVNDTLVLSGTGMPNNSALYFQGTTQLVGGSGVVFGDGLRCVGGTVIRLGTRTNVAGSSQFPDVGTPLISVKGNNVAGGTRNYQVWYRNPANFCSADPFNLTNAVSVTWAP